MKAGVIGTGSMGKNHARIYSELKNVDEVYAFDLKGENRDEMNELGVINCGSMDELLDNVDSVFKAHMFLGMTVFLIFPFTRLVHVLTAPVNYLGRAYQIVRAKRRA